MISKAHWQILSIGSVLVLQDVISIIKNCKLSNFKVPILLLSYQGLSTQSQYDENGLSFEYKHS
jgi:hypothetical protein